MCVTVIKLNLNFEQAKSKCNYCREIWKRDHRIRNNTKMLSKLVYFLFTAPSLLKPKVAASKRTSNNPEKTNNSSWHWDFILSDILHVQIRKAKKHKLKELTALLQAPPNANTTSISS